MKCNWFKCFSVFSLLLLCGCETTEPNPDPDPIPDPAINLETHHYDLPVIFHVIYNNPNNFVQTVTQKRLATILERVNSLFSPTGNQMEDMNLSFVLAETDPDGVKLTEKGVERIYWTGGYPIDFEKFMKESSNVSLIWDPNKYINVMVYVFTDSNVGGVSHFPYTVKGANALEGLSEVSYSHINASQLNYPHCISINADGVQAKYDNTINDPSATLGHEFGHYLGLYHVFSELENEDACGDTDYCTDTPSYNRKSYETYFNTVYITEGLATDKLVVRTSCSGTQFTSFNLMDYYVSFRDRFSADQQFRVRNVLNYSPLIPGPKANDTKTTSSDEKLDLPMRIMRCSAPVVQ